MDAESVLAEPNARVVPSTCVRSLRLRADSLILALGFLHRFGLQFFG
jgi:hypothetical protein